MAGTSDPIALNVGTQRYQLLMDFLQAMTSWTPTSIQAAASSGMRTRIGLVELARWSFENHDREDT